MQLQAGGWKTRALATLPLRGYDTTRWLKKSGISENNWNGKTIQKKDSVEGESGWSSNSRDKTKIIENTCGPPLFCL